MRDAAARSVDVPHAASVFIEILAYRDCRVHPSHSARLRGRRSIASGFIDSAQPSVFWLHLRGGHPGGSSAGRHSGSEQAGCELVPFDVSSEEGSEGREGGAMRESGGVLACWN